MPVVTNEPIQISYFVDDISSALIAYNRLRWHRSRTGQNGLYEPMTAAAAGTATLLSPNSTPHQLNGKTLSFRVNGVTQVDVTFSSADPVTTAQAATEISGETALVTAVDDGGFLRLTTVATGTAASIEILESDAAPYFGWATGDSALGVAADTILVAGTHEYFFTDQNSDESFWYRVEFRHSGTGITTGMGVPFPSNSPTHVPASASIVCFVRLASARGAPRPGQRITFLNAFLPNAIEAQDRRWGIFRQYEQIETDRNGYAETRLLRGITVDISFDGTGFVRRIQIPTTGDRVDLLDPLLVVQDEFGIAEPNIDFAIRTT
jgi:hypothetical protein